MVRSSRILDADKGGAYFEPPIESLRFIKSGCRVLDCVLGGGYPLGRISNVVGDKSTGKTLLAIEASANFIRDYPKGKIYYRETESAFDKLYAEALGMPIDRIDFGDPTLPYDTVEDMFEDLQRIMKEKSKSPSLYIVDSLDALSDRSEMARAIDEGSYNLQKQKLMSRLFRQLVRTLAKADMHVMIVSQVRDNIGVMFGDKHTRSGGRALDFYASQILWLSHKKTVVRTIKGTKRPTGIRILAKAKKNKVGMPMLECEFEIRFRYGILDIEASVEWLESVKRTGELVEGDVGAYLDKIDAMSDVDFRQEALRIGTIVDKVWKDVEHQFIPGRRKYG